MKRILLAALVFSLAFVSPQSSRAAWFGDDKQKTEKKADTVYDLIRNNKDLERFADMISSAGLKDLFSNKEDVITVFAPTDEAIDDIPSATMKRIKASKENLQNFVRYHVVAGSRIGYNAINGRRFSAAASNGESISFDGTNSKNPPKVNDGHLVTADMQVGSSVVHTISAALIPSSLSDASASAPAPEAPAPTPAPTKAQEAIPAPAAAPVIALPTAPVGTSANAKINSTKLISIGTSAAMPLGSSGIVGLKPIGTSVAVPMGTAAAIAPVAAPAVPAVSVDTQKSGGFNFFGHHFGN